MNHLLESATQSSEADPECFDIVFREAEAGRPCFVRSASGTRRQVPVGRWFGGDRSTRDDRDADAVLLESCTGSTLDLGCGPGRFAAQLSGRGTAALGVDSAPTAVEMTRRRGADAVLGSIFDRVPGEGSWSSVLLADGNVGIGGDPLRVLRRARQLVAPHGKVLAEVDGPGTGLHRERIRFETGAMVGEWYDWARIEPRRLAELAASAGLEVESVVARAGRHFVELRVGRAVTSSSSTGD